MESIVHTRKNNRRSQILRVEDIPPLSVTQSKLLRLLNDESVDLSEIAQTIEEDPGITARIIGLANSSYFKTNKTIVTVKDAIVYSLGLQMVKSLCISLLLSGSLDVSRCQRFSMENYWKESLGTALCSKILARHSELDKTNTIEDAYLCGLLHALGKVLLAHLYPQEYNKVLELEQQDHQHEQNICWALQNEAGQLGINHCEAAVYLGRKWQLPKQVVVVMENYLIPEYTGQFWDISLIVGLVSNFLLNEEKFREDKSRLTALSRLSVPVRSLEDIYESFAGVMENIDEIAKCVCNG